MIAGFSGKVWLVRFGPTEQQRANIARVRTRRIPDVLLLKTAVALIDRVLSGMRWYKSYPTSAAVGKSRKPSSAGSFVLTWVLSGRNVAAITTWKFEEDK